MSHRRLLVSSINQNSWRLTNETYFWRFRHLSVPYWLLSILEGLCSQQRREIFPRGSQRARVDSVAEGDALWQIAWLFLWDPYVRCEQLRELCKKGDLTRIWSNPCVRVAILISLCKPHDRSFLHFQRRIQRLFGSIGLRFRNFLDSWCKQSTPQMSSEWSAALLSKWGDRPGDISVQLRIGRIRVQNSTEVNAMRQTLVQHKFLSSRSYFSPGNDVSPA